MGTDQVRVTPCSLVTGREAAASYQVAEDNAKARPWRGPGMYGFGRACVYFRTRSDLPNAPSSRVTSFCNAAFTAASGVAALSLAISGSPL